MNRNVFFWSITVALAGLLFGLDTAVISGAEQAIQQLWNLTDAEHGLAIAAALYGTVIGALLGGIPADRFGRKPTLLAIGVLFLVSAFGSALATDVVWFIVFRLLGGLAIGSASVSAPLYISEVAPANSRGRLVALFQFNIVFGILLAYVANYFIAQTDLQNSWRWMLGWVGLPSLLYAVAVLFVPESPRWLVIKRNDVDAARRTLERIDPATADSVLQSILASRHDETSGAPQESLFARQYRRPVMLAFLFAFFNQTAGINAIIYFAPRIFEMTGLGKSSALLSSAGIGLTNFIFTFIALNLIDRYGRRTLMWIGTVVLILTLSLVSYAFFTQRFGLVPLYLFVYIAFFGLSQGAVIWVFISEIFPNAIRASGQALGSFTHWIFAALITNVFPYFANNPAIGGGPIFAFFAVMMVLQLLYVWKLMPETKGKSLESLEGQLTRFH
jgi:SP family arabinose:H+ symporter-like MFS transporter